jgi:L-ornithine Nalpha-acyltransferase
MGTTTAVEKRSVMESPAALPEWAEIRAGSLGVHIGGTREEIEAAQALRYRIFYGEMGGKPDPEVKALKRDFDMFDDYCDHLLVLDYDLPPGAQVVGTYRLLRRKAMHELGRFYSEGEFDIRAIKQEKGEILELGRSCVDANYRNRAVMQLLWRGIASYVSLHDIKIMFGCGSFIGTDVKQHAMALSYLHHFHLAPAYMRAVALPDQYVEMDLMPREAINVKEAFASLPALIKGYLRLSGFVGHGAVIDPHCNTLDVGIVVKTDMVTDKYAQRYSTPRTEE